MIFDSIVMLLCLLLTLLLLLRYLEHGRALDYAGMLIACLCAVFTKDYGLVVVAVVAAFAVSQTGSRLSWRATVGRWAPRLAPLLLLVVVQLSLRSMIVGPLPSANPVYTPSLSFEGAALKLYVLASALTNASLTWSGTVGAPGLGTLVATVAPTVGSRAGWADVIVLLGGCALLAVTLAQARRSAWLLVGPRVRSVAYFVPTLLTRNIQIYYAHESLAGISVLVGMGLDRANRRLIRVWAAALMVIIASGAVSNAASLYSWQAAAGDAEAVNDRVLTPLRGQRQDARPSPVTPEDGR